MTSRENDDVDDVGVDDEKREKKMQKKRHSIFVPLAPQETVTAKKKGWIEDGSACFLCVFLVLVVCVELPKTRR